MKTMLSSPRVLALAGAVVLSASGRAWAAASGPLTPPLPGSVSIDEFGVGLFIPPAGGPGIPLPVGGVDIGPGALPGALVYHLPAAFPPPLPGDVGLIEIPGIPPSDFVRFNPNGTIVFYSDFSSTDPADAPADIGLPAANYPAPLFVTEFGPEGLNGVDYTPFPGDPGFDPTGTIITYHLVSDSPEPASLSVLALGSLLLIKRKR